MTDPIKFVVMVPKAKEEEKTIDELAEQYIADRNEVIERQGVAAGLGIDSTIAARTMYKGNGLTLKELKALVDKAVEYAGERDADVEVWLGPNAYRVGTVVQFGTVLTLSIELNDVPIDVSDEDWIEL